MDSRWRLLLAALALAGCDRVFNIGDPYQDANPGADSDADSSLGTAYRKTITISPPSPSALADVPISITETGDADLVAHVRDSGGADIGFVDAVNAPLPCEIVGYDAGTGALDAWVLVPTLPAHPATTTVDLVYGQTGTRCTTSPWPANHVGVWHAELATNQTLDSTPHDHDFTSSPASSVPTVVNEGIAGRALGFDGSDDSMCAATDADGTVAFGTSSFSYSIWFNTTGLVSTSDSPFERGGRGGSTPGFGFYYASGVWKASQNDNAHATEVTETLAAPSLNRWINIVAVVDRDVPEVRTYVDGIPTGTGDPTGYGSMTATEMMCVSPSGRPYHGAVDEMRVYAGAVSAAWVNTTYTNLAFPSSTIAFGPEH